MTPQEIAARLTPAQRRALLWHWPNGACRKAGRFTPCFRDVREMGLSAGFFSPHLTSLGEQVRAILAAQEVER